MPYILKHGVHINIFKIVLFFIDLNISRKCFCIDLNINFFLNCTIELIRLGTVFILV